MKNLEIYLIVQEQPSKETWVIQLNATQETIDFKGEVKKWTDAAFDDAVRPVAGGRYQAKLISYVPGGSFFCHHSHCFSLDVTPGSAEKE